MSQNFVEVNLDLLLKAPFGKDHCDGCDFKFGNYCRRTFADGSCFEARTNRKDKNNE